MYDMWRMENTKFNGILDLNLIECIINLFNLLSFAIFWYQPMQRNSWRAEQTTDKPDEQNS
jgi:hypothetical protein